MPKNHFELNIKLYRKVIQIKHKNKEQMWCLWGNWYNWQSSILLYFQQNNLINVKVNDIQFCDLALRSLCYNCDIKLIHFLIQLGNTSPFLLDVAPWNKDTFTSDVYIYSICRSIYNISISIRYRHLHLQN